MSFPYDVSDNQFDEQSAFAHTDDPAPKIPTSVGVTALAVSILGPIALLPAAGWWAAKTFSK